MLYPHHVQPRVGKLVSSGMLTLLVRAREWNLSRRERKIYRFGFNSRTRTNIVNTTVPSYRFSGMVLPFH